MLLSLRSTESRKGMSYVFNLFNPQDGIAPNKQKPTPIRLVVHHKGKQYRKMVGMSVLPADFKKQRTKDPEINRRLRLIEVALDEKLDQFTNPEDVAEIMDYAIKTANGVPIPAKKEEKKKKGEGGITFWAFIDDWIARGGTQERQRRLFKANLQKFMGTRFGWDDIDTAFHFRLILKMQAAGFALNYQWRTTSQLKALMSEARRLKLHTNMEYTLFQAKREDTDAVYLTKEEVELLWNYQPKGELKRKARDLFMIGIYTAARFSDYSRLSMDMIQDGVIRFHQEKTRGVVMVPASTRVIEILKRNGGRAPALAQQHLNEHIKLVCKDLGINTPIEVSKTIGASRELMTKEKWQMVSSHTARRTGATLLYMTGVPLKQVMLITGHKDEKAIRRYLRLTNEENAALLKDNEFFK